MLYSIILACTFEGGIGYNNDIPWNIKSEIYLFKQITGNKDQYKQNAVIMGRNTWESLPHKPLKDRLNIIPSYWQPDFKSENIYIDPSARKLKIY